MQSVLQYRFCGAWFKKFQDISFCNRILEYQDDLWKMILFSILEQITFCLIPLSCKLFSREIFNIMNQLPTNIFMGMMVTWKKSLGIVNFIWYILILTDIRSYLYQVKIFFKNLFERAWESKQACASKGERQTQETEKSSIHYFTLQMASTTGAGRNRFW